MTSLLNGCIRPLAPGGRAVTHSVAVATSANLDLQLVMSSPIDDGGPIGSLLTFRSATGRDLCAIGFSWSYSSRVSGPNRQLQAWCAGDLRRYTLEDLGRPTEDVFRGSIATAGNRIIELTSSRVFEEAGWRNGADGSTGHTGLTKRLQRGNIGDLASYSGITQSIQTLGGSELRFVYRDYPEPTRVVYDDRIIARVEWDLAAGLYAGGHVWLSPISGGAVFRCRFEPAMETCGAMEEVAFPGGGAYAMAWDAGNLWIAGDQGRIWRITGDEVVLEYDGQGLREDGYPVAGEFYAFAFFGDRLIATHYPSGVMLGRADPKTGEWLPFGTIRKSTREGELLEIETEIQSLVQWGGELWAGVYPFGELWVVDMEGNTRKSARLFSSALDNLRLPFPYADEILGAVHGKGPAEVTAACRYPGKPEAFFDWYAVFRYQPEANTATCLEEFGLRSIADWAQRVTSLAIQDGHLYAATGNRLDHGYSRVRDGTFLPQRAAEEYGRVWRVSLPGHASQPFDWPPERERSFSITLEPDRTLTIRDNASANVVTLVDVPVEDIACVASGAGPFGRIRHAVQLDGSPWPTCDHPGTL